MRLFFIVFSAILFSSDLSMNRCVLGSIDEQGNCCLGCYFPIGNLFGTSWSNSTCGGYYFYDSSDENTFWGSWDVCQESGVIGDINDDEITNILDIVVIVGFIVEYSMPSSEQLSIADVNNDTIIDVLDIVEIINYIFEFENFEPVEPEFYEYCEESSLFTDIVNFTETDYMGQIVENGLEDQNDWNCCAIEEGVEIENVYINGGIPFPQNFTLNAYPNPFSQSNINVSGVGEINLYVIDDNGDYMFSIMDEDGNQIQNYDLNGGNSFNLNPINLGVSQSGLYRIILEEVNSPIRCFGDVCYCPDTLEEDYELCIESCGIR